MSKMTGFVLMVIVSSIFSVSQASGQAYAETGEMTTEHLYSDGGHRFVHAVLVGHDNITDCQVYGDRNVVKHFDVKPVVVSADVMTNMIEYCHRIFVDIKTAIKHRHKRALINPGTLWCGVGNIATTYSELGYYRKADGCCRTHDHCSAFILKYQTKYGLYNNSPYTRSHCDCDNTFYDCLKKAHSRVANDVGRLFFNLVGMTCFEKYNVNKCTGWLLQKRCKSTDEVKMQFRAGRWF